MIELTLTVPDISCAHCKASIEEALGALEGVGQVEVDVEGKTVEVVFDPARLDRRVIVEAVESQGYRVPS